MEHEFPVPLPEMVELPLYNEVMLEHASYFRNPQNRFNSFYECDIYLRYNISDYIKSGFVYKDPCRIVCYQCKLETILSVDIDPCVIHKQFKKKHCKYASKNSSHCNDSVVNHELSVVVIMICAVLIICIIYASIHFTSIC